MLSFSLFLCRIIYGASVDEQPCIFRMQWNEGGIKSAEKKEKKEDGKGNRRIQASARNKAVMQTPNNSRWNKSWLVIFL